MLILSTLLIIRVAISSQRIIICGGGVGMYINNSSVHIIKTVAWHCDLIGNPNYNIDYMLIEQMDCNFAECCMYCSPDCKMHEILIIL